MPQLACLSKTTKPQKSIKKEHSTRLSLYPIRDGNQLKSF